MSDRTKRRALAEIKLDFFSFPVLQSFPRDLPSGIFAVGETGRVSFDLLFEKNRAGGDLGWFSLRDIELQEVDSQEFIREIVRRTKSNSDLGGSILRNRVSRISGNGEQILPMNPGETFALAFFPEGIESEALPILSLSSRRFADAGEGRIVAIELSDGNAIDALTGQLERPYTDSIFQVKGATAQLEKLDALVTREQDWRETSFGREILATCSKFVVERQEQNTSEVEEVETEAIDLLEVGELEIDSGFEPRIFNESENNIRGENGDREIADDLPQGDSGKDRNEIEKESNFGDAMEIEENNLSDRSIDEPMEEDIKIERSNIERLENKEIEQNEIENDGNSSKTTENEPIEEVETMRSHSGQLEQTQKILDHPFASGVFTVGESGEVGIDFLFDGGKFKSELAIFSLEGMGEYEFGSTEFIEEAIHRALSNSKSGYVVIKDRDEGAKFDGDLGEKSWNKGEYKGVKTFQMEAGTQFGIMLIPDGTVMQVNKKPKIGGKKKPLFSMALAGKDYGQIADLNGEGHTFAMEDVQPTHKWFDRDYNDIIFQVKGATGTAQSFDNAINPEKDWRLTPLGQEILEYVKTDELVTERVKFVVDAFYNPNETLSISGLVGDEDGAIDISRVDFWLQKDGGEWVDINDALEFSEDGDRLRFRYELEDLDPGKYRIRATPRNGAGKAGEVYEDMFTVLSVPEGAELSNRVKRAIARSMRLESYDPHVLQATRNWIVSVRSGESATELAELLGAKNLGVTGHISNTYTWEFSAELEARAIAELLEKAIGVEYAYPLVSKAVEYYSNPTDTEPLVKNGTQWHLQSNGNFDANISQAWENHGVSGEGVTIGVVDGGFAVEDRDRNLQTHLDLSPNYNSDLSYDFDDNDAIPSALMQTTMRSSQDIPIFSGKYNIYTFTPAIHGEIEKLLVELEIDHPQSQDLEVNLYMRPKEGRKISIPLELDRNGKFSGIIPELDGKSATDTEWEIEIINPQSHKKTGRFKHLQLNFETEDHHGTNVAGVAAASGSNAIGGSGVAPEADWAALRAGADGLTGSEAFATFSHKSDKIDIYNNSWGLAGIFTTLSDGESAIERGIKEGRGGLGSIYLFAAGNNQKEVSQGELIRYGNVNYNSFANSRHTIAVGAIDHTGVQATYSAPGAPLLVSAHSNSGTKDDRDRPIVTTKDYSGDYTIASYEEQGMDFSGTSAATPLVSGVVALMLEANPRLTSRDVQAILLETAQKNDPSDEDWYKNSAGYWVNHKYGFGAVDADAAVALAKDWAILPQEQEVTAETGLIFEPISDLYEDEPDTGETLVSTLTLSPEDDLRVEWVEVEFIGNHQYAGDLEIVLVSPNGTRSILAESHRDIQKYAPQDAPTSYDWIFTSVRNWGESAAGEWHLEVTDREYDGAWDFPMYDYQYNFLEQWKLNVYGTTPNIAPKASPLNQSHNYIEDEVLKLKPIAVLDADGDNITAVLQLSDASAGELRSGNAVSDNGILEVSGSVAEINSILAQVEFVPTAHFNGNLVVETSVTDGKIGAPLTGEIQLTGTPVNDAPMLEEVALSGAIAGQPLTIAYADLLAASNATDVEGDAIAFIIESLHSGTLTQNGNAVAVGTQISEGDVLEWTPEGSGDDISAFSIKATDGMDASEKAIDVTVDVASALNTPPTLTNVVTLGNNRLAAHFGSTDPTTEGWKAKIAQGNAVGAVTDNNVEAWFTDDNLTSKSSFTYYSRNLTDEQIDEANTYGWKLSSKLRVIDNLDGVRGSILAVYRTGTNGYQFHIESNTDGNAVLSFLTDTGYSRYYTLTGIKTDEYHRYEMVFDPETKTAKVLVDGVEKISGYQGYGENGNYADFVTQKKVSWGSGSSPDMGEAYWNQVQFETLKPQVTQNKPFTITYADLLAASDATDADGDSIAFVLDSINNGTLTKNGQTVKSGEILSQDEEFVWTPDSSGGDVAAFRVTATDGKTTSTTPVQVAFNVAENPVTFFTPDTPYLSFNDSPFKETEFKTFHLENFEDGELNTPGVRVNTGRANPSILSMDSVDADDGTIDGSGSNGRSWWIWQNTLNVTFDETVLGELPTHAGIVWTDGGGGLILEAFDANGNLVGQVNQPQLTTIAEQGNTAEDRFFGVTYDRGISAIKLTTDNPSIDWEVDHLQYGIAGTPQGATTGEIQVNTYTASSQSRPTLATLADGSYIVTWQSYGQDGSRWGVFAQRYDVLGNPLGEEFPINTETSSSQGHPSIAALSNGDFIVAWTSWNQDGNGGGIFAQRFDGNADRISGEFQVNSFTTGEQIYPAIASLTNGDFVITWQSEGQDGSNFGIFGQRYDSQGNTLRNEFQINTTTASDQSRPAISSLQDGGFLITWSSEGQDGDFEGIYGQRYDVNGVKVGGEFNLNTYSNGSQYVPTVTSLEDGGFVVAWQSEGQDGSAYGIFGRRFDSNSQPVGSEFRINTEVSQHQVNPAIAPLSNGGFVVTWQSFYQDGANYDIYGQRFDGNGNAVGDEFQINTTTNSRQMMPAVMPLDNDTFVVAWQSYVQDGEGYAVINRIFGNEPETTTTQNFAPQLSAIDLTPPQHGHQGSTDPTTERWMLSLKDGNTVGAVNDNGIEAWSTNDDVTTTGGAYYYRTLSRGESIIADTYGWKLSANLKVIELNDSPGGSIIAAYRNGFYGYQLHWGSNADGDVMLRVLTNENGYETHTLTGVSANEYRDYDLIFDPDSKTVKVLVDGVEKISNYSGYNASGSSEHVPTNRQQIFWGAVSSSDTGEAYWQSVNFETLKPKATQGNPYTITYEELLAASDATDANGDDLAFVITSIEDGTLTKNEQPIAQNATLSKGETLTWTPDSAGDNVVAFTVKASDGALLSGDAVDVAIDVTASAPVAPVYKIGNEFQVNSQTENDQTYPAIAALKNGGFVIVWPSQNSSNWDIYGQRYDNNSNKIDGEFLVNSNTLNFQQGADITGLENGGFIVTWQSFSNDWDIYGQRYDENGSKVGNEFLVNTNTLDQQQNQAVTALKNGGFVITWEHGGKNNDYGILGQIYDENGNKIGSEFTANSHTHNDQWESNITALKDGGFVITWESQNQDGSFEGVYAQRYNSNGEKVGGEFRVNSHILDRQETADLTALEDGGFIIAWESNNQDGNSYGIYAQRYDSNGEKVGGEFQVNSHINQAQRNPSVTSLQNGGYLIAWTSQGQDGSGEGIYTQRYDSNGNTVGGEIQVNSYTSNSQSTPDLVTLTDGSVVIVWDSQNQDGSDRGIFAQRFGVAPTTPQAPQPALPSPSVFHHLNHAYNSEQDSPIREDSIASIAPLRVETFEDGVLDTLGVTASRGSLAPVSHSIEDNGNSWQVNQESLTFTFDGDTLGALPTRAGVAVTDIANANIGTVAMEIFDSQGISLGVTQPEVLGTGDRFFGAEYEGGISKITFTTNSNDWNIDHLQYG